jgi:hypothetical protein
MSGARRGRARRCLVALTAAAPLAWVPAASAVPGTPYYPVSCGVISGPAWQLEGTSGRSWVVHANLPCAAARRLAAAHLGRVGSRLPAPPGWRCEGQPFAGTCFRLSRRGVADVDWTVAGMLAG